MRIKKTDLLNKFIAQHAVFTWHELSSFLHEQDTVNINTQKMILHNRIKRGQVLRVRRQLYLSIGNAFTQETVPIDPYLIAGKATDDAVLAYHTALEYHGYAYSTFFQSVYLSNKQINSFSFRGQDYISSRFSKNLVKNSCEYFACSTVQRSGVTIKVTDIERTFVDSLDRPNLCGGWEEVIRSLEMIASMDIDKLIQYAILLGNATTVARTGYMLECLKNKFYPTEKQLTKLEQYLPKKDHYFDSQKRHGGTYLKRWKLIVANDIYHRTWEEFNATE